MPLSNQPLSLRYLKARLRILKRPQVWGAATSLLLAIVFVAEYWLHPEQFIPLSPPSSDNVSQPPESDDEPTDATAPTDLDESASGIETLPSLTNTIPQSGFPTSSSQDEPDSGSFATGNTAASSPPLAVPSPDLGGGDLSLLGSQGFSTSAALDRNSSNSSSFNTSGSQRSSESQLTRRNSAIDSTFPLYGTDSLLPATAPLPINPLQTALDRYSSGQSNSGQPNTQADSSSNGAIAPTSIQPGNVSTPAPLIYPGQMPVQTRTNPLPNSYFPQTSPPPGTTGYTLPPSINLSPPSSSVNPYTRLGNPQLAPGFPAQPTTPGFGSGASYGNFNSPYSTSPTLSPQPVQPPPAVISQPSSLQPRRNGQINTFSNP
jgi:hypothetical protein